MIQKVDFKKKRKIEEMSQAHHKSFEQSHPMEEMNLNYAIKHKNDRPELLEALCSQLIAVSDQDMETIKKNK